MDFDVAVVHHQVLGQVVLERVAIDDIELAVALKAVDQPIHPVLELDPVLLVVLHFALGLGQVLVELLQVVVVVDLLELVLLGDLGQVVKDFSAELAALFAELLLHFKQVPVGSDAVQHVVEEVVKVVAHGVSDANDVVSQSDLVLGQVSANFPLDYALLVPDVLEALFNLLLQRCLEIEFVD